MVTMIETEARSILTRASSQDAGRVGTGLEVEREDICFYNLAPDRLRIEVTVHNRRDTPSSPAPMMLQFAAFGAFVPWTPLQLLQVPRVRPGGSRVVRTEVFVCKDGTLVANDGGAFAADRDRYRAALGTLNNDEQLDTMSAWQVVARRVREQLGGERARPALFMPTQKADLRRVHEAPEDQPGVPRADLHQGRSAHWVGNINVLMNDVDVERHEARAFRIYPERVNRSWFFLGGGNRDVTSFELWVSSKGWSTRLYYTKPSYNLSLAEHAEVIGFAQGLEMKTYPGELINLGEWTHLGSLAIVAVEICPPEDATKGTLGIQVCQRSVDCEKVRKAVVEFDFSESAVGPGCYTVGGS